MKGYPEFSCVAEDLTYEGSSIDSVSSKVVGDDFVKFYGST